MSDPTPATGGLRPVAPWERALGVVGKVLVSSGLLLLAFVGYQLWGTGIEQAQRQSALSNEFQDWLTSTTTVATSSVPPTTTTPATTVPVPTVPVPTVATTTTSIPDEVPAPLEMPQVGQPVARMEIPRLDVDQIVVVGVGPTELKSGPGLFPDTPLPGQLGNSALAGHRTSYGAPFGDLDQLEPGDEVLVTTREGRFRYVVTASEVVDPTAVYVIDTVDRERATLTLVTCHPKFSIRQRLIVYADLDTSSGEAPQPPTPISVAPTTTLPRPSGTEVPTTSTPVTLPSDIAEFGEVDPFAAGWFADDGAWWHVAGWGLALIAIAIAATRLGRARSNERFGAVVGLTPFLVVLYFFFQNVNRLLPPGL